MDIRRGNPAPEATKSVLITLSDQAKDGEKRIVLKVQGQREADDGHFCYWIGKETPLRNLMLHYTPRVGVAFNSVRFHYNGSPIIPAFTADEYRMKDGDNIDVVQWKGFRVMGSTLSTLVTLPLSINGEKSVVLKVVDVEGKCHHYSIWRNTRLDNLRHDYAERISQLYEHVLLSHNDQRIRAEVTTDELGLEDGDTIHAYVTLFISCRKKTLLFPHFFCLSSFASQLL